MELARQAEKSGWTRPTLLAKIKEVKTGKKGEDGDARKGKQKARARNRLIPKRGSLNTYQIVRSETIHGGVEFLIDLGFATFKEIPAGARRRFQEGNIFVVKGKRRFVKLPKATRRDLFTYRAFVERVVDADNLWLRIDLGFGLRTRRKPRLRGIDAPELGTEAGRRAKRFVENELKDVPFVTLTTTKPDKFDRYLSDVYYEKDGKEIYLNQLLLDKGFARLVRDDTD